MMTSVATCALAMKLHGPLESVKRSDAENDACIVIIPVRDPSCIMSAMSIFILLGPLLECPSDGAIAPFLRAAALRAPRMRHGVASLAPLQNNGIGTPSRFYAAVTRRRGSGARITRRYGCFSQFHDQRHHGASCHRAQLGHRARRFCHSLGRDPGQRSLTRPPDRRFAVSRMDGTLVPKQSAERGESGGHAESRDCCLS